MVQDKVRKTMRKALLSFAEKENKGADSIAIFIHTKPTDEQPMLLPKYFYAVDGTPVQENGRLKELRFVQDILGKKMDLMGMEAISANFLATYFKNTAEEVEADPKTLYIMIKGQDEKANELTLALYKGSKVEKHLKLEDIFGE
jgi:hypothetical protein